MSRDHWDAILASAPLNATAGKVASKGDEYTPAKVIAQLEWDTPPELAPLSWRKRNEPTFQDFTGLHYGRLTVLGIVAGAKSNGKGMLWACRCACGKYVARRTKALRNASPEDRCSMCQYTRFLAKEASGNRPRERAESEKARKWTAA